MNFTEEDVVLAKERILAVQEILDDLSKMFDLAGVETKEVKTQVKETKKEEPKKEQPKEENDLSEVIQEYDLEEMTEEELKEYLTDYDIKFPVKAKKQKLMELVAQAIVDGVIATGDEEEEVEEDEAEDEAVDSDGDSSEMSKREEEEEKILASIEQQVADKKLTKKKAQEWLKELYANHDTCKACPKNCQEDPLECYKAVQVSFVDDEGEVHDTCEGYIRDGVAFCCGVECEEFEGDKVVCTVCGEVYDMGEDD